MDPLQPFTMPLPDLPDIEILRMLGNVSTKVMTVNCTKCRVNTSEVPLASKDPDEQSWLWIDTSEDVMYYAFPVMIVWGVLSGLVSLAVIVRHVRGSSDSYLLGLVGFSILLLACGGILKSQDYIGYNNTYQEIYGYVKSINDWLWYTSLWILVVMALDRGMTVLQSRSKSLCTPLQASVIMLMIVVVCLVSALPQFWEYEVTETFDYGTNKSLIMSELSKAANSPEYRIMYFWYTVTITVFLPYPVFITMTVVLARGMKKTRLSKRRLSQKQKHTSTGTILNRKITEDSHMIRLYIVLLLLYILLTGPFTFLVIVNGIVPHWAWPQENIYTGLYPILEFVFYFYFSMLFLLLCSYSDRFRRSLKKTCCCCCIRKQKKAKKKLIYTR